MPSVLFSIPIKTGKYFEYKAFVQEILGPKKEAYQEMLQRYGLKNAKVWHHTIGATQYLFTLHEITPEAPQLLSKFATSSHPFDTWFHDECLNVWDVPNFSELPEQPTFIYEIDA